MIGLKIACIPCHNDHKSIVSVVSNTLKYVDKVILIDDGSMPPLQATLPSEYLKSDRLILIRNKTRLGYGFSLKLALKIAGEQSASVIVLLDADGQHDPNEIPQIIDPILKNHADFVIGDRFSGGSLVPFHYALFIKFFSLIFSKVSSHQINDALCGFRAFRKVPPDITEISNGMGAAIDMLTIFIKNHARIEQIPVKVKYGDFSKRSIMRRIKQFAEISVSIFKSIFYLRLIKN